MGKGKNVGLSQEDRDFAINLLKARIRECFGTPEHFGQAICKTCPLSAKCTDIHFARLGTGKPKELGNPKVSKKTPPTVKPTNDDKSKSGAIVGYARVSTRGQSLEAQIKALAEAGVTEEHLFKEKESGAKTDRPQLAAMLKFARKGDTVIATKLDRIARSTKHLLEIAESFDKKGVTFKILNLNLDTSTPTGKLMLTMLAGIAQFEREMMLERQAEGFAIAMAKGRIKGRPTTAQDKASDVRKLASEGLTKQAIADAMGIGIASVYRILKK